ncbi:uncharacterized protein LOC128326217 isoform X2 [Hemicordylus capensis]|uniref:uncharacterized protein LOC128326217 isoform X2 n=1 Tax=Hemicordylus capensis TaxID=884348 RepID=UPI0023043C82|nr:uncharacterized protein LOC128326217 isoform X2 [Hemicordylus capensis]
MSYFRDRPSRQQPTAPAASREARWAAAASSRKRGKGRAPGGSARLDQDRVVRLRLPLPSHSPCPPLRGRPVCATAQPPRRMFRGHSFGQEPRQQQLCLESTASGGTRKRLSSLSLLQQRSTWDFSSVGSSSDSGGGLSRHRRLENGSPLLPPTWKQPHGRAVPLACLALCASSSLPPSPARRFSLSLQPTASSPLPCPDFTPGSTARKWGKFSPPEYGDQD